MRVSTWLEDVRVKRRIAVTAGLTCLFVLGVCSSAAPAATSTLGVATVGSLSDGGGAGYLDVSGPYTTAAGTIASLSASIAGEAQTMSVRGVVYTDASGRPGSLVAATSEVHVPAGAPRAWVTLPFPSTVTLAAGGYWLGFWYGAGAGSGGGGFANAAASGSEWYAAASYSGTSSPPAGFPSTGAASSSRYSVYATVAPAATVAAPSMTAPPSIAGSALAGSTLTASTGSWSGSPTSYAYQWQRCDASGGGCATIALATASGYALTTADVGSTVRVAVTAANAGGSTTATSAQTPVVQAATTTTSGALGTTAVGTSSEVGGAGYLDVNGPYAVSGATTASKLVAYVAGTASSGTIRPVVYQSSSGNPGALVAVGPPVSVAANQPAGWVDLPLGSTVSLPSGSYFVGFWYGGNVRVYEGSSANVERYASDSFSSSGTPHDPFGSAGTSSSSYSVYLPYEATTSGTSAPTASYYEDAREGFPKVAAYRPGCAVTGTQAAAFDWLVTDGHCVSTIDAGYTLNPHLLGMIQPTGSNGNLFAATYGQYDLMTSPVSDPTLGTIRAFTSTDWLHNLDGSVHNYGSVNVLNWLSSDTARWSADVVAYWAKQDGALAASHPGIAGVWGDNDLWSDQGYAFTGTALDPSAAGSSTATSNRATWDTNDVAHHNRLASDLPGMVIGGNDISSYSDNPGSYLGTQADGWRLPGVSSAGMRECADRYFGLYDASGVDTLVNAAQTYVGSKALDGQQRYLMLNNCNASSTQVNEYSLAVATIAGMYYWPYTGGDWSTTLSIAPSIPDVTHNGVRNWLGAPTAAPQRIASGLWKRTFEHGVVYANMSGTAQTVDGHALGNETGLFVAN